MLYQVVHRKPMHIFKKVLLAIALMAVSLAVGLVVGQWSGKEAVLQNGALLQRLNALEGLQQSLERELAASKLAADVQEQAAQELQQRLTQLLGEKVELENAVSFYRDLMEVGAKREGLRVASFTVLATNTPQIFQFSILVTQIAEKRKYVAGDIQLKVIGILQGGRQEVIFDAKNAVVGFPLKLRFKYFQDLVGQIRLPPDFIPERVSISVQQNGKKTTGADFEWSL
ncbi:MAG: hypothetical protein CBB90_08755 [Gammaproteobacteria bacterium TMED30]|jgi:hypothetical protein|nr:hypothetical protein [Gammaproteobacteria bacterium]OUU01223.1 MAG: hypothetical protein CBB90_08755 [Gammaproteobacteria bacterium TMED30]